MARIKKQLKDDKQIRADWSKLTKKQKELVSNFLQHGNKIRAYRESYDANPKARSFTTNCYAEFNKPYIKAIIAQIRQSAVAKANISYDDIVDTAIDDIVEKQTEVDTLKVNAYWVLRRAALLADFNIKRFIELDNQNNAYYDFSMASDDDWYCIQEYTVDEIKKGDDTRHFVERTKLKTHDKLRALELVSRFLSSDSDKDDPLKQLAKAFQEASQNINIDGKIDVEPPA